MEHDDLHYFNPWQQTETWKNRLPHWQQDSAIYFITIRLNDSIPQSKQKAWETERDAWLAHHPEPWTSKVEREYHLRFSHTLERWLDDGYGECVLRDPACRRIVAAALAYFEGTRHHQIAWVVMPNHVHALFILSPGERLADLMHSWKSFTSNEVNALTGKTGTLWQKDYFDRLVRDGSHLENCIRYIRRNPVKARLHEGELTLFESEFAKSVA